MHSDATEARANIARDHDCAREVLKACLFGALLCAAEARKADGLTLGALAERLGTSEASARRMLTQPERLRLSDVSRLCVALDLRFDFQMVDRGDAARLFLDTGPATPTPGGSDA